MYNQSPELKVCFISSRTAYVPDQNTAITDWANGRLISELFKTDRYRFSLAIFDDPIKNNVYGFQLSAQKVYRLPFPYDHFKGMRNTFRIFRLLKEIERENDVLIVQVPIIGFLPLLFIRKPVIYHVCSNVLTASANKFKYRGFALLTSRSFAFLIHIVHNILFSKRKNKVIVNGEELAALYRRAVPKMVVSSTVYSSEVVAFSESATRTEGSFRILFIGRPSKEKGIDQLFTAFRVLLERGRQVSLHMIGVEKNDLLNGLLGDQIPELIVEQISVYGFVSWGEQFKKIVSASHCLVMSSVSEGTPRVLIEARALGCPVIATKVGGVGSSITDGVDGLLIQPQDASAIVSAVEKLLDNETFRMNLVKNGLKTASRFTVESFVKKFTDTLKEITPKS